MENEQFLSNQNSADAVPEPQIRRCARCGSVLYGDYCSLCGLPERGYAPYTPPPKKKSRAPLWITLGALGFIALCTFAVWFIIYITSHGGFSTPYEDNYLEEQPYYGEFDFNFGYSNESTYMRVEALYTARTPGTMEYLAPEGKEFIVVNLRVTNLYSDIISYDTSDFELACGKGNLLPAVYTDIDSTTALNYGRLLPGGEVEGSVVFMIPEGELNLELFVTDYETTLRFPLL